MENRSKLPLYLFLQDISLDGGCERVVVNMANEFIKYYENVHIVSNFQTNLSLKFVINEQVKINYLHKNISIEKWKNEHLFKYLFKSGFIYKIMLSIGFTNKLYHYVNSNTIINQPSIIMFHGYDCPIYKKNKIKLIGVDHSNFPFYKNKSFIYRKIKFPIISFMIRNLDFVTVLSDAEIDFWKWLKRPIEIMPNFIPNIPTKTPNMESRNKKIISMGRMNTDQKGFDRLIKAFSKISKKYPDWKLEIYGDGELKKEYQKLIDQLSMNSVIKLENFSDNPFYIFSNNSIYAMCSRTEGFGLVLAEAMACGMAAISYENTGPNSIINNGNNGYLIENNNEKDFCDKLEQLIKNIEERKKLSVNAREHIISRFSEKNIINKWIKIFNLITKTN